MGHRSAPCGERPGQPAAAWETELAATGEVYVPDGAEPPRPSRAARRAAARARRRKGGRR